MPIQQEQSCLVYITNACSVWYFAQFVVLQYFMSLLGPAGAYSLATSVSPIHVVQ